MIDIKDLKEYNERSEYFDFDKYLDEDGNVEATDATYETLSSLKCGKKVIKFYRKMFDDFLEESVVPEEYKDKAAVLLSNVLYFFLYDYRSYELEDLYEEAIGDDASEESLLENAFEIVLGAFDEEEPWFNEADTINMEQMLVKSRQMLNDIIEDNKEEEE